MLYTCCICCCCVRRRHPIKFLHLSTKVLLTPPDEGPRVKGQRIKLQDIVDGVYVPQRANGSWIDGEHQTHFLLSLSLSVCLSDYWLISTFFYPFCSRGVSVPGSFGTHLSAQCSQSHGTCPHVQYDIRKYKFPSLPLSLSFIVPFTDCLLLICE